MFEIGKVVGGKYRLDGVVGAGGMGIVFAATHLTLGREVCLKFLLPTIASQPNARERFAREARFASALRSDHVGRIFDVEALDDGTPYIVMERIDGVDLGTEIARRGPLPIEEALALVRQACAAMSEAHAMGIVHRDLKPQNLLLARSLDGQPTIKVVDFGIARAMGDCATTAGAGTLAFMAPEQARKQRTIDARGDVYALGAILYFLLTGSPPFASDDVLQLALMIHTATPARVATRRSDVAPEIDAIVMRCLARDADRRFANASALAAAIDAAAIRPSVPSRNRRGIRRWLAFGAIPVSIAWLSVDTGHDARPPIAMATVGSAMPRAPKPIAPALARPTPATPGPAPAPAPAPAPNVRRASPTIAVRRSTVRDTPPTPTPIELPPPPPIESVEPTIAPARSCRTDDFLCQFGGPR